jgi:NAD(P)-dependent dehydrogenase (short-subunit alcohol dehydrogenase family)
MSDKEQLQPPQHQDRRPGIEADMTPRPRSHDPTYHGSGKLRGKVALVTGGDSGIGRAVATFFAKERADVAIAYLDETQDAEETKRMVEAEGRRCLEIAGDIGDEAHCQELVRQTVRSLGKLDILVNNAAEQHPHVSIKDISAEQLERTFRTNIFAMFFLTKAALDHLKPGSAIINTSSVTAYNGSPQLLDYSSTKRGDRRLHAVALSSTRRTRHPGQQRRSGSHLDPPHSVDLP